MWQERPHCLRHVPVGKADRMEYVNLAWDIFFIAPSFLVLCFIFGVLIAGSPLVSMWLLPRSRRRLPPFFFLLEGILAFFGASMAIGVGAILASGLVTRYPDRTIAIITNPWVVPAGLVTGVTLFWMRGALPRPMV